MASADAVAAAAAGVNFKPVSFPVANRLKNKVAIVTGASTGMGKAAAIRLAAEGAKVVLVARTKSKLEAVQKIIKDAGGEAVVGKSCVHWLVLCVCVCVRVCCVSLIPPHSHHFFFFCFSTSCWRR